jgi:hypothetical protein
MVLDASFGPIPHGAFENIITVIDFTSKTQETKQRRDCEPDVARIFGNAMGERS